MDWVPSIVFFGGGTVLFCYLLGWPGLVAFWGFFAVVCIFLIALRLILLPPSEDLIPRIARMSRRDRHRFLSNLPQEHRDHVRRAMTRSRLKLRRKRSG